MISSRTPNFCSQNYLQLVFNNINYTLVLFGSYCCLVIEVSVLLQGISGRRRANHQNFGARKVYANCSNLAIKELMTATQSELSECACMFVCVNYY